MAKRLINVRNVLNAHVIWAGNVYATTVRNKM